MSTIRSIRVLLLFSVIAGSGSASAGGPPRAALKAPPTVQSFVAAGPSAEADLGRLRVALEKVAGVVKVDVRAGVGGATLVVKGDVLYTLLAAAAKTAGFTMEPTPARFYAAGGPTGDAELTALRTALGMVPGVDKIELSRQPAGAALRISGVAKPADLTAAGRSAGFALRQLGSYAASGPSAEADLARLRAALRKVTGVEQVELQGLVGGATLLIYGDVKDAQLVAAAKNARFALWPLRNAAGRTAEFKIGGKTTANDHQKLADLLRSVEGMGEIEVRVAPEGPLLLVTGGRQRSNRIIAAAAEGGFELVAVDDVTLPSLIPRAGRNTPPDYDDAILEDPVRPNEAAPQFTLLTKDGENKLSLSDYVGKKPVVLMFGSCT